MLLLAASVVDRWVTIQAQPVLNMVLLGCQKVQDSLHTVFLRKHLVVHFDLFFLFIELVVVKA